MFRHWIDDYGKPGKVPSITWTAGARSMAWGQQEGKHRNRGNVKQKFGSNIDCVIHDGFASDFEHHHHLTFTSAAWWHDVGHGAIYIPQGTTTTGGRHYYDVNELNLNNESCLLIYLFMDSFRRSSIDFLGIFFMDVMCCSIIYLHKLRFYEKIIIKRHFVVIDLNPSTYFLQCSI